MFFGNHFKHFLANIAIVFGACGKVFLQHVENCISTIVLLGAGESVLLFLVRAESTSCNMSKTA